MVLASFGCSSASNSTTQPPRWKQVWADDFNGPANGSANTANWGFDTGRGVFGTGEIETMTSSTSNVYYDGQSHLVLQALHSGSDARFVRCLSVSYTPYGNFMSNPIELKHARNSDAAFFWIPAFAGMTSLDAFALIVRRREDRCPILSIRTGVSKGH